MMAALISVDFTCVDAEMARETFRHLDFAESGLAAELLSVGEGRLDASRDETLLPEYRALQGCTDLPDGYQPETAPSHMRTYVGRIRLVSVDVDPVIMRTRILSVPIGNDDCGFTIDSIERLTP